MTSRGDYRHSAFGLDSPFWFRHSSFPLHAGIRPSPFRAVPEADANKINRTSTPSETSQ